MAVFSQTAEYALRVTVYLAGLGGAPATIPQIAAATHVSPGYLAKVLRSLAKAGIIQSRRGAVGGSVLSRPAREITVYDVVQAVDPIARITVCPLGLAHKVSQCALHRRLDEAIGILEHALRESTIAALVPRAAPAEKGAHGRTPRRHSGGGPG